MIAVNTVGRNWRDIETKYKSRGLFEGRTNTDLCNLFRNLKNQGFVHREDPPEGEDWFTEKAMTKFNIVRGATSSFLANAE